MIRLACSTASFPQEPLERAMARVAWAGFEAVEIALPDQGLEGIDREDLKARLRANELDVAAIHAGRLGARDAQEALEAAGRIGRAALLARELDGSRVVAEPPEDGSMEHLAAGLITTAEYTTEAGQAIAAITGGPLFPLNTPPRGFALATTALENQLNLLPPTLATGASPG